VGSLRENARMNYLSRPTPAAPQSDTACGRPTNATRLAAVGILIHAGLSAGVLVGVGGNTAHAFAQGNALTPPAAAPATPPPAASPPPETKPEVEVAKPAVAPKPAPPAVSVPAGDPEKVRNEKELQLRRRFVPEALTPAELDALSEQLGMNPDAKRAFVTVRDQYERLSKEARGEKARELLRILPAAYRYDPHETEFTPVFTPELLTALRQREEISRAIVAAETNFERDLGYLADPARRAAWRLVRTARHEVLHSHPTRLPGARINLLDLLPKCGLADTDFALLDSSLDRYAEDYVRALKGRDEQIRSIETRRAEALVALGPEWRAGRTIPEAQSVRFDTAEVRSDIELRDLNAATLERIRKLLSPVQARRVLVAWQSAVHPELFEEDRLVRQVMEQFVGMPGIAPEDQSAAIDRFIQLEDLLWPLGQQAVELADSMVVAERLSPTDAAQVRIALEEQIHRIQIKRRKAVRDSLKLMEPTVPAEQIDFTRRLQDTLATLEGQDRASFFLMDQLAQRQRELATLLAMGETPAVAAEDAPTDPNAAPATVPVGSPETAPPPEAGPTPPSDNAQNPAAERESPPPSRPRRDGRGSRSGR
jgi:hypothetical protein